MRSVPDIAAMEIKRLRDDGVKVTDDDVVWLASLGYKVENPRGQTLEAAGLVEGILLSNGDILYPLTISSSRWLGRYGNLFLGKMDTYAVAFAMCHPKLVAKLKSANESVSAINDYANALAVQYNELVNAVSRMVLRDAPHDPESKNSDSDKIVASLVAITGLPFEYWNNQPWIRIQNTYTGALQYANILSAIPATPNSAESKSALRDLLLAIKEIRKRK